MTRLVDRFRRPRAAGTDAARYYEGDASGAAVLFQTYGTPDREQILPTFQSYADAGYQGNSIVFALIGTRLGLFTEAAFKWRDLRTKKLFGDASLASLEFPWPNGSTGELLARAMQDYCLAGNWYCRRVDIGDVGWERLRPDGVTIVSELLEDRNGRPYRSLMGYYYDTTGFDPGRDPAYFEASEVVHWSPVPDPRATFRGMSWLTPVVREIEADQGMTEYKNQYLENAATPNLLVKYDQTLSQTSMDRTVARIQAAHGGKQNAYKTLILDRGADATVIGSTFDAMNFVEVQSAGENRIAAAAGVPGIVAGLREGLKAATYSNFDQAMRRFADLTIRPEWRSLCRAFQPHLEAVPAGAELWFDVTDVSALRQSELDRAETFDRKATTAGKLVQAGYEPQSVAGAVDAADLSMLVHSGKIPVTLYDDQGQPPSPPGGTP